MRLRVANTPGIGWFRKQASDWLKEQLQIPLSLRENLRQDDGARVRLWIVGESNLFI
jgi:hypothetical protein